MPATHVVSLAAAVGLALVHLFAGRLRFLDRTPRSSWLSFAGGISVAYVFLHLMPELAQGQEHIREVVGGVLASARHHVYLLALLGLAVFYGLERMAVRSRRGLGVESGRGATPASVFWIHVGSFALYNLVIGYLLLHREGTTPAELGLYAVAMGLHFTVNDYGLREHHRARYDRVGRLLLSAAVLLGWAVGLAVEVPEGAVVVLIALLGGGVILNVLKEELPEERESRFSAFAAGLVVYSGLLLAL